MKSYQNKKWLLGDEKKKSFSSPVFMMYWNTIFYTFLYWVHFYLAIVLDIYFPIRMLIFYGKKESFHQMEMSITLFLAVHGIFIFIILIWCIHILYLVRIEIYLWAAGDSALQRRLDLFGYFTVFSITFVILETCFGILALTTHPVTIFIAYTFSLTIVLYLFLLAIVLLNAIVIFAYDNGDSYVLIFFICLLIALLFSVGHIFCDNLKVMKNLFLFIYCIPQVYELIKYLKKVWPLILIIGSPLLVICFIIIRKFRKFRKQVKNEKKLKM